MGTSEIGYNNAAVVLENGLYYLLFFKNGIVEGAKYDPITVSGTAAPRASGKNVYDLALEWHDNPALLGHSSG